MSAAGAGSFGVSITFGMRASLRSRSSSRNGGSPSRPLPMCSWRSSPEPSGAFASLR